MSSIEEPQDLVAEASGASAGEAKWTAMKELEPRFPGVTAAATTAVLATGDGPGETALATTAVLATG